MNIRGKHRTIRIIDLMAAVILLAGFCGCGSEGETRSRVPAPPPAPPPFQPQAVEVGLGASGQSITLMTTETGGFTLNGEAVSSGDTYTAENGNYTLTLTGDTWTAEFAPNMIDLPLGASGDTVTIVQLETGGYSLGGEMIAADTTYTASNGATYGVGLGPDGPVVVYIPATTTVALGEFGGEITLTLAEDQMTFFLNGEAFASGTVLMSNNRSYTVTMGEDGTWSAEFNVPMPTVGLGGSGHTIMLAQDEAMVWWINPETRLESGDTFTMGDNDYTLRLGTDGTWTATFEPNVIIDALGRSGEVVTATQVESGGYLLPDGMMIGPDSSYAASNGANYRVTLAEDGTLDTVYIPSMATVMLGDFGGEMTLVLEEDQETYTHNGEEFTSGMVVMSNDRSYTVTMGEGGTWSAEFIMPVPTVDLGGSGNTITLTQDEAMVWWLDPETAVADGDTYTMGDNDYTLTLADGTWTATFAPRSMDVGLGSSGESVTLTQVEAGGYMLPDGMMVGEDTTTMSSNGATYGLMMGEDGAYTAMYMPTSQTVMLGELGGTITLVKQENQMNYVMGGETEAFTSGRVLTVGDNDYTVTMGEDGFWSAAYNVVTTTTMLGGSGDMRTLMRAENGDWTIDGDTPVTSGDMYAADGRNYLLTLADGTWTAAFQPPDPVELPLGTSGESVTIHTAEDGSHRIGDRQIAHGASVQAANGNSYTLSLASDGQWAAMYMSTEATVDLGTSGSTVILVRQENGRYTLNGQPFQAGETVLTSDGGEYELRMAPDGMWTAVYRTVKQSVLLGTSGFVTLIRSEDGSWSHDDGAVSHGDRVVGPNGLPYRLEFRNGYWTARVAPESIPISGTPLTATLREDGQGYRVGTSALLPPSGRGTVTVDGAMYHVRKERGRLTGVQFDRGPHGRDAGEANFQVGLATRSARLANSRTILEVGGGEFSIGRLLRNGSASSRGGRFVAGTRNEIRGFRRTAELAIQALGDDRDALAQYLRSTWQRTQNAINALFGRQDIALKTTIKVDEVLEALDAVIEALSSEEAFRAATQIGGDGVLVDAALNQEQARQVYTARQYLSEAILGATGDTRYGAVHTRLLNNATSALSSRPDGAHLGAFAYSTIADTPWSWLLPNSGSATYSGGTTAISGDGRFYRGEIELLVRFGGGTVTGLISNFKNEDGQVWTYLQSGVENIRFPDAVLTSRADWSYPVDSRVTASIDYQPKFFRRSVGVPSSFAGHLLGTGENAGSQAVGVWSVGTPSEGRDYLVGGFGAVREAEGSTDQPVPDDGNRSETTVAPPDTEIGDGVLTLRGTKYGPNLGTTGTPSEWDDEVLLLEDGRRIEETYQIPLTELFSRQGAVSAYLGRNLVDLATEEIRSLREKLVAAIGFDDDSELWRQQRARIWDQINERVRARLFGTADTIPAGRDYLNDSSVSLSDPRKWSNGYPVSRSGEPDDEAALAAVDAVLDALATAATLESALAAGVGGVFTRADGRPVRPVEAEGIAEIWKRSEARIMLSLGSTTYTRFGAWRKQTAPNAWSSYKDRTEANENGPNSFAYSQLPQSRYADLNFPSGGSATYQGETVAVQATTFYRGPVELVARWHADLVGPDEAGLLTAVLRELKNEQGDLLTYSDASDGTARELAIEAILLDGIGIRLDAQNRLFFSDHVPAVARLRFENVREGDVDLTTDPSVTTSIEGKFVGFASDGPRGVIGIWTLLDSGDTKIGTGDMLYGAFGAEVRP